MNRVKHLATIISLSVTPLYSSKIKAYFLSTGLMISNSYWVRGGISSLFSWFSSLGFFTRSSWVNLVSCTKMFQDKSTLFNFRLSPSNSRNTANLWGCKLFQLRSIVSMYLLFLIRSQIMFKEVSETLALTRCNLDNWLRSLRFLSNCSVVVGDILQLTILSSSNWFGILFLVKRWTASMDLLPNSLFLYIIDLKSYSWLKLSRICPNYWSFKPQLSSSIRFTKSSKNLEAFCIAVVWIWESE